MKVKVNRKRSFLIWLAGFLFGAAMIFGSFFYFFFKPWDYIQPVIISIYVIAMITLLIVSLFTNYYEIQRKYFVIHKFGKEVTYNYSDIIYIDEEYSLEKKTILFVTRFYHVRYVTFDEKGLLYQTMLERCNNLMSKEQLKAKNPSIKI